AGIAEVVRLVDEDHVRHVARALESGALLVALEVRMVENDKVAVNPVRQVFQSARLQRPLPYRLPSDFRHKQSHALSLLFDQVLDQHETNEGLAQAHSVAQQGATVAVRDLEQLAEAVPLI